MKIPIIFSFHMSKFTYRNAVSVICLFTTILFISCDSTELEIESQSTNDNSTISVEQVIKIANQAMKDFYPSCKSRHNETEVNVWRMSQESLTSEESPIYIVQYGTQDGYVVVSSQTTATPILAISESGSFPREETPLILQEYLSSLNSDYAIPSGGIGIGQPNLPILPDSIVMIAADSIVKSVNCNLPVKWGQDYPYNKFCPEDYTSGKECLTGCGPVALGQIMAFYRFPESINIYHLDWDYMLTCPTADWLTLSAIDMIAHLLRELGIMMKVSYTRALSGCNVRDFERTLKECGYSSYHEWVTDSIECKKSLQNSNPVIAVGFKDDKTTDGHIWVIDGYREVVYQFLYSNKQVKEKTYLYMRMNWGWNGGGDGYYLFNEPATLTNPSAKYVRYKYLPYIKPTK